jgi:DNA repair exonuclease SbcCD ATPase subunit
LILAKQQTKNQDTFIRVLQEDHQQKITDNRDGIKNAEIQIAKATTILQSREMDKGAVLISLGDVAGPRMALQNVERSNRELERRMGDLILEVLEYKQNPSSAKEVTPHRLAIQKLEFSIGEYKKQIRLQHKEIEQYEQNPVCPTCHNKLSDEAVTVAIQALETKQSDTILQYDQLVDSLDDVERELQATVQEVIDKREKEIKQLEESLRNNTTALLMAQEAMEAVRLGEDQLRVVEKAIVEQKTIIASQKSIIQTLQKQIAEVEAKTGNIDAEQETLRQMAARVVSLIEQRTALHEEKQYLDIAATMLKDSGIKTKVIRQYLDTINRLVNLYLQAMDFFVLFTLDEEFKEVIKSSFRDEFSYENFSEGEKQRIDLALTLTWRAIAKAKNSMNTNLLILDEVFDSSLDVNGTEYVMRLLDELGTDTNVFVISHKGVGIEDRFTNTIRFVKKQNFSLIED